MTNRYFNYIYLCRLYYALGRNQTYTNIILYLASNEISKNVWTEDIISVWILIWLAFNKSTLSKIFNFNNRFNYVCLQCIKEKNEKQIIDNFILQGS